MIEMLWTGSVISEDTGDDLAGDGIGAEGGNDAQHCEAAIQFFGFFVVCHGEVLVGVDVHFGFFGPHVLLAVLVGGNHSLAEIRFQRRV